MTGWVDDAGRALITVSLRHPSIDRQVTLDAWVDTGFNGHLVLPQSQIAALALPVGSTGRAVLADGSEIELMTYSALVDWFGTTQQIEVIANNGQFPLLGVGLLLGHQLHIDYDNRQLTLS